MLFDRGFGTPKREGSADFGRPIADGVARWEGPAILDARTGEAARPMLDGAGDADRMVLEGDAGRANREVVVDGVVERGIPNDLIEAWDSGRRGPVGVRGDVTFSLSGLFELGPGTRRSRSSS